MGPRVKVSVLASESLGVRSMCVLIQTPDISLLSDGGASLGMRYGLLPHPAEYRRLSETLSIIDTAVEHADVISVSHYHLDHYRPPFFSDFSWTWSSKEEVRRIYRNKTILLKDIRENINFSQKRRGWFFLNEVSRVCSDIEVADGGTFRYGDTTVSFSRPLPHGEAHSELGYVLATCVRNSDEVVVHAPDVQGPACPETTEFIVSECPDLVVVGGPPTYLGGSSVSPGMMRHSAIELARLVSRVPVTVVDHHLMRDELWREKIAVAISQAQESGHILVSAAAYMGKKEELLESRRQILYREQPPDEAFMKWTRLSPDRRRAKRPPV